MMATGATAHELMDVQVELSVENAGWGAMILSEMYAIRESSDTCDVTLVAAVGSHVRAHSGVLSAASSFLMQLIQNAMKSNASSKEVVIRTSFSHEVISNIIDFLYKGKTLPRMSYIPEIKKAAKTFGITNLVSLCDIFEAQHGTKPISTTNPQSAARGQYSDLPQIQPASLKPDTSKSQGLALNNEMHHFDDDDDNCAENDQEDLLGNIFTAAETQEIRTSSFTGGPSMTMTDSNAKTCDPTQGYPGSSLKTISRKVVQKAKFNKKKHRYECDICHRIFSYKYRMTAHRAAHSGEKSKCDICEKTFIYPESLYQHKKLHLGQSFQCPHCDKSFKALRNLRTHSTVHTKKFSCAFCNKRFATRPKMEDHERTHTGEKPFTCDDCGKQYRLRDTFNRHKIYNCTNSTNRTQRPKTKNEEKSPGETVEKTLECTDCGKIFSSSSSLKTHRTIHTLECKYFCNKEGCPGAFRLPAQIKRHIKLYHGDHSPIDVRDFVKPAEPRLVDQQMSTIVKKAV